MKHRNEQKLRHVLSKLVFCLFFGICLQYSATFCLKLGFYAKAHPRSLITSILIWTRHTVDGRNCANGLLECSWTSFVRMFNIRCLPGGARTFFQASGSFLVYICMGCLRFKKKKSYHKNIENQAEQLPYFSMC